jgi:hypothetical protein
MELALYFCLSRFRSMRNLILCVSGGASKNANGRTHRKSRPVFMQVSNEQIGPNKSSKLTNEASRH